MKTTMKMMIKGFTCAVAAFVVLGMAACQGPLQTTTAINGVPETASPDWAKLRTLVTRYNGNRGGLDDRGILTIQSDFVRLYENHANDRIGDEALFYTGRISYDLRDYHTARITFLKHKEQFRSSEFTTTIAALETDMNRTEAEYRSWLEGSRGSSVTR